MPLEGHRGAVEVLTLDWLPHPAEDTLLQRCGPQLESLAEACRRFLR